MLVEMKKADSGISPAQSHEFCPGVGGGHNFPVWADLQAVCPSCWKNKDNSGSRLESSGLSYQRDLPSTGRASWTNFLVDHPFAREGTRSLL